MSSARAWLYGQGEEEEAIPVPSGTGFTPTGGKHERYFGIWVYEVLEGTAGDLYEKVMRPQMTL